MRHYFLKPIRPRQTVVPAVLSVSPASVNLDRTTPGNVATFTASLNLDPGSPLTVTVSSSDPSVTVSPSTFTLGGGNPITRTVTLTGATTGPDSATVSVSAPGQTTRTIAITRPPVPLDLTVTPASLVLDRVAPGNVGSFTVALNRVPDSAVLVSVSSSDASVNVFPASFSLSTGNPPSRAVSLTGAASGPSPVTISVNPLGLPSRSVTVTRPAFTPNVISGLAAWFDAADLASLTLDGSNNVSQWNDKSGNARHAAQATAANRPAYLTNQLNGRAAVRGNGSSTFLSFTGADLSAGYTLLAVYDIASTSASGIFGQYPASGTGNGIAFWSGLCRTGRSGATVSFPTGIPTAAGTPVATVITFDGTNPTANVAFLANWNATDRTGTATQIAGTPAAGTAYVGAVNPSDSPSSANIYEIAIYNRQITTAERTLLTQYVTSKWGIAWL